MEFVEIDRRMRAAFSVAGSAFMLHHLGLAVEFASIESDDGDMQGSVKGVRARNDLPGKRPDLSEKYALYALAGAAAEYHLMNRWDNDSLRSAHEGERKARRFIRMAEQDLPEHRLDIYVRSLKDNALAILSQPRNWNRITVLAYALMDVGTMTGGEVREVLEDLEL